MTRKQWLEFFAQRMGTWDSVFAQIGVTQQEVDALIAKVEKAQSSLAAADKLRLESKAATQKFYTDADEAHDDGQELINKIRNFAATTNNPSVFQIAMIDPPSPPTPLGAPGKPENLVASINELGYITLNWKSTNSAPSTGAFFSVSRALNGGTNYTIVGAVPTREFVDTTIPAGTGQVNYVIQGRRGQYLSEPTTYTVRFGVAGGGNFAIVTQGEVTSGVGGKLAA
ncbi:MAG TPA: hypothetical protein VD997_05620 [Phycisphaerales bacterium]|nr:hypothetical protein [Phycisphaerales bacterium]